MRYRLRKLSISLLTQLLDWLKHRDSGLATSRWRLLFWQRDLKFSAIYFAGITAFLFFIVLALETVITDTGIDYPKTLAMLIFTATFFGFIIYYLKHDTHRLIRDNDALILACLLVILSMILIETGRFLKISPYLVPTTTTAMLIATLISFRLSMLSTMLLSTLLAMVNGMEFNYFLYNLLINIFGLLNVIKIRQRTDFIQTGLKLVGFNALTMVLLGLLNGWKIWDMPMYILYGVANALASTILTLGILPYLEITFARTSNIRLLELSDANHPLLKQLSMEAPGTFHHSLLVASLAEQAADIIHANSLLCRVGAYFHDIGKLSKSEFFIENQLIQQTNTADTISPSVSSLIIISHVKEGVNLALKYNLDRVIIDFIQQHHGTSLIKFFYHKVLENSEGEVSEDSFRYPGPKPQTKEAAIIMLADAVEAATRSIKKPTPPKIKDLVLQIINNQFTDGQFDDCPITLADLHKVGDRFAKTLIGIYHPRIEYPDSNSKKNG
ncbi:MAG: HDIG domain-containing metalloprotein [Elusimicrobiota bacterium]